MQRKIPMLLGKAYERHQRRTIGLTVCGRADGTADGRHDADADAVGPRGGQLGRGGRERYAPRLRRVDGKRLQFEMTTARQEVWLGETERRTSSVRAIAARRWRSS